MYRLDLMDLDQLSTDDLLDIIDMAGRISRHPDHYSHACSGKIMAALFYEPSTRTQMSFQSAMLRLGGQVIGFDNPMGSSVAKGESLADTVRVVSGYSDVVVIRHPKEGAAFASSLYSKVPVINAGDGGHAHPTQTLADIVTLANEKRLDNLTIGICGDLLNGRTVHSLIKTMCRFSGNRFVLISTPSLGLPQYLKGFMRSAGCDFREVPSLEQAIPELDVLYMTRIQRERFTDMEEYKRQQGVFVLDSAKLACAKSDLCVLHPLPRVDEIEPEVDSDPRAKYFIQTEYGMYARMALLIKLIKLSEKQNDRPCFSPCQTRCGNPRCITAQEAYLPALFSDTDGKKRCMYCECEHTSED